jgi:hypothetical protein
MKNQPSREEVFMAINKVRDDAIQRDIDEVSKWCRVLNAILNTVWRLISSTGILLFGGVVIAIFTGKISENLGYEWWKYWVMDIFVIIMIISTYGFAMLQVASKDIIHIDIKIKKEVNK